MLYNIFCFKYRCSSKRGVITVLLPGAVEAEKEILEEGVRSVEDWEPDDVHPLVGYVIQSQQGEFLREEGKDELKCIRQDNLLDVKNTAYSWILNSQMKKSMSQVAALAVWQLDGAYLEWLRVYKRAFVTIKTSAHSQMLPVVFIHKVSPLRNTAKYLHS